MTTPLAPLTVPHMSGSHRSTYDAIFHHPTPHDLKWRDVRSLLASLAQVTDGSHGSVKVARNGKSATLHEPKHGDALSTEDIAQLRHFLQSSEQAPSNAAAAEGSHLLVVIDHKSARIYRTETQGSVPERLVPYDPHATGHNLQSANVGTDGKRKPENKAFYESVAQTLRGAGKVLLFGSGTGQSSAMDHLLAELKQHHPDLAARVIGSVVIDEHHMSEGQLLAKAREFYATLK